MTEPAIDTTTEPAQMTPAVRFLRTLLQVVIALAAATPAAVALVGLPAETTAKVTGLAGAAVILASAIHNAVNQARSTRAASQPRGRDQGDIGLVEVLVIVLVIILILVLVGRL